MKNGIAAQFFRKMSFGPAILTSYFKLLLFTSLAGDMLLHLRTYISCLLRKQLSKLFFPLHDIWKEILHTY